MSTPAPYVVAAHNFADRVRIWAERRDDIRAFAVIGSFARGAATPESDLDLVLVVRDPQVYIGDTSWCGEWGEVESAAVEPNEWVTSIRVRYVQGLEVEFVIAGSGWASPPVSPVTAGIVSLGFDVLLDRDGQVTSMAEAVRQSTTGSRTER